MVNKRKSIKRKLRMLKQLKRRNEVEHTHNNTVSKGDALISSMEALIRKISTAPTAPPSTIVSMCIYIWRVFWTPYCRHYKILC
jgi:hypothetical protein